MIRQPERGARNVNDLFYEGEAKCIDMLDRALWGAELSRQEELTMIWLAGWEESTVRNVISAFQKAEKAKLLNQQR